MTTGHLSRYAAVVCVSLVLLSGRVMAQAQQPPATRPAPIQRLQSAIERITTSVSATWGIYIKSLDTGEEIAINADRQMDTMSVIKIPLMAEVFQQIKDLSLYTSDAADDLLCVDLGGRRIIKK